MANGLNGVNSKKFLTKKPRSINNDPTKANGLTTNGGSINVKHQQSPGKGKLKPVKERRPTALPTEQPKVDKNEIVYAEDKKITAATFFIGSQGDDDDDNDYMDNEEVLVVDFDIDSVDGGRTSSRATSLTYKNFENVSSNKLRSSKLPSTTSSKVNKFSRTPTNASTLSQHEEVVAVHIPTPPPLPPQSLYVPNSPSISLVSSHKNSKCKRNSNETSLLTAPATTQFNIHEDFTCRSLTETEVNTKTAKAASTSTHNGNTEVREKVFTTFHHSHQLQHHHHHRFHDSITSLLFDPLSLNTNTQFFTLNA